MVGDGQFEITEGVLETTADVLGVGAGHTLSLEPVANLEVGNYQGPCAFSDGDRIADVIAVTVGDQDVVGLDVIG